MSTTDIATTAPAAGRPLKFLIVDDDEADRYRFLKMCRQSGLQFQAAEAASLEECEEWLSEANFDLVFIDYHIGMETGQQVLEHLRSFREHDDAIAIMVTSVDRHDVIIEAMRSGCDDYLIKEELSRDAIRKAVTTAIERRINARQQSVTREEVERLQTMMTFIRKEFTPEIKSVPVGLLRKSRMGMQSQDAKISLQARGMEDMCKSGLHLVSGLSEALVLEADCQRSVERLDVVGGQLRYGKMA